MLYKKLLVLLIISIVFQLLFSFYFNSEIISQNYSYSQNNDRITHLEKSTQYLENLLTHNTSLSNLFKESSQSAQFYINQTIDLNNDTF